jgi:DNA repair photolyase
MNDYIYGDARRLFLNTELGCRSGCSYCYLPQVGLKINAESSDIKRASAGQILDAIKSDPRFVGGKNGTLLSVGCFSECWDTEARSNSIELINGLLEFGNSIQMATKREIKLIDFEKINISVARAGQLGVFVSSATISQWSTFERGTTSPNIRFNSFECCAKLGINCFLYIKPAIPGVTILDTQLYGGLMRKYDVPAVVGDAFIPASVDGNSPISKRLMVAPHADVDYMRAELKNFGNVFATSDEAMNSMRSI